ncbi:unnamed protein product [Euphydryas editha]|uniref:DUF4817 domain-containing protein n=1 Tax=Euphydryas editha TaxID=104508 RepID=A0AAU9U0C4_EUPED|nr:unnamed protein product [Euphydryas editha]
MERYTIEQCIFIVEHYLKYNESLAAAVRKFHTKYGRNSVMTSSTVKNLIKKWRHTGRLKTSRSNDNIEVVHLDLHAYEIQCIHLFHAQRRDFVEWINEHQRVDADFSSKIILSNEAHYHLDDFVNRQNCRIWGSENTHVTDNVTNKCIHNMSLFGEDFGLEASLDNTSLKLRLMKQ